MSAGHFSLRGSERSSNEDAVLAMDRIGIHLVVDGVGDSRGAAATVIDSFRAAVGQTPPTSIADARRLLLHGLERANETLVQRGETQGLPSCAAVAAVACAAGRVVFAWCGDCRGYLVNQGRLRQVTKDHTRLGEMESRGVVSAEDVPPALRKSALTRCLGRSSEPGIQVEEDISLSPGDVVLLCSDGVSDVLSADEIHHILRVSVSPDGAVSALTEALQGRTLDDASAVVVMVGTKDVPNRDALVVDEIVESATAGLARQGGSSMTRANRTSLREFFAGTVATKYGIAREVAVLGVLAIIVFMIPSFMQLLGSRLEVVGTAWWALGAIILYAVVIKIRLG